MAEAKPAALTLAQKVVTAMCAGSRDPIFDHELCKAMTVVSASLTPTPRAVFRLTVTPAMCNLPGTLHGGAICTLFDVCTTVALAMVSRDGHWEIPGVTRTLSTTCLVPVFPGEEIEIEGEVVRIGKKLVHILARMTLFRTGKVVATGVHDKVNVDTPTALSGWTSKL